MNFFSASKVFVEPKELTANLSDLKISGTILTPSSGKQYHNERLGFNRDLNANPSAIALVESEQDIVNVIKFAKTNDLNLSIYGGGHSVYCSAPDTLCLNLTRMKKIEVDVGNQTVTIQGGVKLGELD
ncbi:hypothetical protein HK099_004144, partial [Clydaea vesicula]